MEAKEMDEKVNKAEPSNLATAVQEKQWFFGGIPPLRFVLSGNFPSEVALWSYFGQ